MDQVCRSENNGQDSSMILLAIAAPLWLPKMRTCLALSDCVLP